MFQVELKAEMSVTINDHLLNAGISVQNDIHPLSECLSAPNGQKQLHAVSNQRTEFSVCRGGRARSPAGEKTAEFIWNPPDEGEFIVERISAYLTLLPSIWNEIGFYLKINLFHFCQSLRLFNQRH